MPNSQHTIAEPCSRMPVRPKADVHTAMFRRADAAQRLVDYAVSGRSGRHRRSRGGNLRCSCWRGVSRIGTAAMVNARFGCPRPHARRCRGIDHPVPKPSAKAADDLGIPRSWRTSPREGDGFYGLTSARRTAPASTSAALTAGALAVHVAPAGASRRHLPTVPPAAGPVGVRSAACAAGRRSAASLGDHPYARIGVPRPATRDGVGSRAT